MESAKWPFCSLLWQGVRLCPLESGRGWSPFCIWVVQSVAGRWSTTAGWWLLLTASSSQCWPLFPLPQLKWQLPTVWEKCGTSSCKQMINLFWLKFHRTELPGRGEWYGWGWGWGWGMLLCITVTGGYNLTTMPWWWWLWWWWWQCCMVMGDTSDDMMAVQHCDGGSDQGFRSNLVSFIMSIIVGWWLAAQEKI